MFKARVAVYPVRPALGVEGPEILEWDDVFVSVSFHTANGSGGTEMATVDVTRPGAPKDADNDTARLARFEIQNVSKDHWLFPGIDLVGWLEEWTVRDDFGDDYEAMSYGAYVPIADESWTPRHVLVRVMPHVESL